MDTRPKSWLDGLLGVCLSLLAGALAVFIAIRLIEAVWVALLVVLGGGTLLAVSLAVLRTRNRGW